MLQQKVGWKNNREDIVEKMEKDKEMGNHTILDPKLIGYRTPEKEENVTLNKGKLIQAVSDETYLL